MTSAELFAKNFSLADYLADLEHLVNIDSYSYNPEDVNRIGQFFYERFEALGWHCEYVDLDPRAGKIVKACNHEAEQYDITFVGHMDTVFPRGTAAKRPFRTSDDGYAWGPGVIDMKQGDLAMYTVAQNLSAEAQKLNICMLFTPDEEIGSPYSKQYLAEMAKRSKRVFIMEACLLNGEHCHARKGKLFYQVDFHGVAAHAGFLWEVDHASAVWEMGHWITELMTLLDPVKKTSVNVAPVSGGQACNIVADSAHLECEMRFYNNAEAAHIQAKVRELAKQPLVKGVKANVTELFTPAWTPSSATLAYVERVKAIAQSLGQEEFISAPRGGLSDANVMAQHCDVVLDGMAPWGLYGHSERERLNISTVMPSIQLCCALLDDMAQ